MANGELLVMDPTGVYNLSEIAGSVKVQQPWNSGASTLRFESFNAPAPTSCDTLSPPTPFYARKCPFPTG